MRILTSLAVIFAATSLQATSPEIDAVLSRHVLPGYASLAEESADLAEAAEADCAAGSPALRAAYGAAFDAWIAMSHLRFGPSETDDRAFALAFWPDPRSKTPKALGALIRTEDPAVDSLAEFQSVSIAARGFYALEFLLFDTAMTTSGEPTHHCKLVQAVTKDIADLSSDISTDWATSYGALMRDAGSNDTYKSEAEALRQLFTALSTGLEFTVQARLGRPLGTFDKPRPKRAEARRSGRSLRHVQISLASLQDLAGLLVNDDPKLTGLFDKAVRRAAELDDPVFAGVADPQTRFRVEALQQDVENIRSYLSEEVGPRLGIAAGFNSLDGD